MPTDLGPPSHHQLTDLLKERFHHNRLRPNQSAVIRALLASRNVLFTAPTGHGKSLTYQLPALYFHITYNRLTLVVTPLLSLMHNQLASLHAASIPAAMLSSAESPNHNQNVVSALYTSHMPYALLYLTPEKLTSPSFLPLLQHLHKRRKLALVAVDEAHCISEWGHDFRKAYSNLGFVKAHFPQLPIIALTATATPSVQTHIISSLRIPNATHIHTSFLRTNIHYQVRYPDNFTNTVEQDIYSYILTRRNPDSSFETGIIYAFKRTTVDTLARLLNDKGIPALAYHAGLSAILRKKAQQKFETGECPIVVASTAFGMGIDVSNIRYVIHHSISKSLESFYQESGRAGRDFKPCNSIVYYSERDFNFYRFLNRKKSGTPKPDLIENRLRMLVSIKDYCTKLQCRRVALLRYFGEKAEPSEICGPNGCDVCFNIADVRKRMAIRVGNNTAKRPSSRRRMTSTPAADFQTARSMLKVQSEREKVSQCPDDTINDFSDDEADSEAQPAASLLKNTDGEEIDFVPLAKKEKVHGKEKIDSLKKPHDRIMKIMGMRASSSARASKSRRSRKSYNRNELARGRSNGRVGQ